MIITAKKVPHSDLLRAIGLNAARTLLACLGNLKRHLRKLGYTPADADPIEVIRSTGWYLAVDQLDPDLLDWPLRFADLELRPDGRQVRSRERVTRLKPRPTAMLAMLIGAAGEIVTDDTLHAGIWGQTPGPQALRSAYGRIQRTLEKIDSEVRVERVAETGYRLIQIRSNGTPQDA